MISILDIGMGNIGSIVNMLKYLGIPNKLVRTADDILLADKLILPGVGNWDNGVKKLQECGLINALSEAVLKKNIPILGICLGMQLLFDSSEEGALPGLGWIPGKVVRFRFSSEIQVQKRLRIPHMGWNVVTPVSPQSIISFSDETSRFYFVHSYHVSGVSKDDVFLMCEYGYPFVCGVHRGNIWGVQFHPEKSHKFGMDLMRNFAAL